MQQSDKDRRQTWQVALQKKKKKCNRTEIIYNICIKQVSLHMLVQCKSFSIKQISHGSIRCMFYYFLLQTQDLSNKVVHILAVTITIQERMESSMSQDLENGEICDLESLLNTSKSKMLWEIKIKLDFQLQFILLLFAIFCPSLFHFWSYDS